MSKERRPNAAFSSGNARHTTFIPCRIGTKVRRPNAAFSNGHANPVPAESGINGVWCAFYHVDTTLGPPRRHFARYYVDTAKTGDLGPYCDTACAVVDRHVSCRLDLCCSIAALPVHSVHNSYRDSIDLRGSQGADFASS
jgi:hypothetical protein